jgi:hypothetical protein
MSTPMSADTLAILAAFRYSGSMSEAVADAFRALAPFTLTPDPQC